MANKMDLVEKVASTIGCTKADAERAVEAIIGTITDCLKRGEEVFNVNCAICHGESGDGLGITSHCGVPGIANLTQETYAQAAYPDGRLFDVISNGKGNMGPYKHNVNLRDRWAIVAYVRALQFARKAPYEAVKEAYDKATAATATAAQ